MQLKKTKALLMSAVILLISLTGCTQEEQKPPVSNEGDYDPSGNYQVIVPDVSEALEEAITINADVVGWLQVPNTKINEPVVQTGNNEQYLRLDWRGRYSYDGCFYMDFESIMFNQGKNLAQNSIIYGHNLGSPLGMRDDPDGAKFAQLLKFDSIEIAEKTPYFYFTTPSEVHVFEIFAVFYSEDHIEPVPYHYAEYSADNLTALVKDVKTRSLYHYDVDVAYGDNIMTLSTCTYKFGTYSQNPYQRFVVMGRKLRPLEPQHETAELTANENPKPPDFSRVGKS